MSDRRALLTEREREIVAGDADVSDAYRYQTISRVRSRLDRLAGDLEALEAHGDLAEELRDRICGDATADSQRPPDSRESVETPSQPAADQHVDGDPSADMTSSDANDDGSTVDGDASSSDDDLAAVVDRVAETWEDSTARIDARKAAALAALEYARENGTISKQEAKENIEPDHPVDGQNQRTWYRNNIRPVLNEIAEYDNSERGYRLTLGDDR